MCSAVKVSSELQVQHRLEWKMCWLQETSMCCTTSTYSHVLPRALGICGQCCFVTSLPRVNMHASSVLGNVSSGKSRDSQKRHKEVKRRVVCDEKENGTVM